MFLIIIGILLILFGLWMLDLSTPLVFMTTGERAFMQTALKRRDSSFEVNSRGLLKTTYIVSFRDTNSSGSATIQVPAFPIGVIIELIIKTQYIGYWARWAYCRLRYDTYCIADSLPSLSSAWPLEIETYEYETYLVEQGCHFHKLPQKRFSMIRGSRTKSTLFMNDDTAVALKLAFNDAEFKVR